MAGVWDDGKLRLGEYFLEVICRASGTHDVVSSLNNDSRNMTTVRQRAQGISAFEIGNALNGHRSHFVNGLFLQELALPHESSVG